MDASAMVAAHASPTPVDDGSARLDNRIALYSNVVSFDMDASSNTS